MSNIAVPLLLIDLNGDGFHLLVELHAFGKKHFAVIDTGASRSVFDKNFIGEHIQEAEELDAVQTVTLFTTSSSIHGLIPKFKIGKLSIKNYPVVALDLDSVNDAYEKHGHPRIVAILGGDIFYNHQAKISYKKKKIYFSSKPIFAWPG